MMFAAPDLASEPRPVTPKGLLGAVRHENMRSRLYTHPSSAAHLCVLDALEGAGFVAYVPATPTSLAGWLATPLAWDSSGDRNGARASC